MEHISFPLKSSRIAPFFAMLAVALGLGAYALTVTAGFPVVPWGYVIAASAASSFICYTLSTHRVFGMLEGALIAVSFAVGLLVVFLRLPIITESFQLFAIYFLIAGVARIYRSIRQFKNQAWIQFAQGLLNISFVLILMTNWNAPISWILGTVLAIESLQIAGAQVFSSILVGRPSKRFDLRQSETFGRTG